MLGGVLIDILLGGELVIYVIKGVVLPHAEMWVVVYVLLALVLVDLRTEILHDRAGFVIPRDIDDGAELATISLLTGKWRSHSYNDFEVIVPAR